MSSDYVFRNATFGGFNKDDVIQFITSMKKNEAAAVAEKAELLKEIEALRAENAALTESLATYQKNEQASSDSLSQAEKEISTLTEMIAHLKEELAETKSVCESKLQDKDTLTTAQIKAIRAEYEDKVRCCSTSDRSVQEAVGSAMIDVRRFADILLQETCDRINIMSDNADDAATKTLARILDISSSVRMFTERFNAIMTDISAENDRICREVTAFKGSLRIPFETAIDRLDTDILSDSDND